MSYLQMTEGLNHNHVTQFPNFWTRLIALERIEQSASNLFSEIVADFFTRFMLFTEEDLGHVYSKWHLNIWFDSKIITI